MAWLRKTAALLRQGWRDIRVFREFRRTIDKEIANPSSKYNMFKLERNRLGNVLYKTVDLPSDYLNPEVYTSADQYYFVMDLCRPVFAYLQMELNFGEYMLTEVYHYEPEDSSKGEVVNTFQAEFVFKPIALTRPLWWLYTASIAALAAAGGAWAWALLAN